MIVLDTHIWVWWIHNDARLTDKQRTMIQNSEDQGLGISIISCWEVAKLVELKKLTLHYPIDEWLDTALSYPGVRLLPLTLEIALESTRLPGTFHRDPADQIIVATARLHDCPLLTIDTKILNYPHVRLLTQ
ncbi:MAG: type II toxin-antitoxin system VapC family toxin [Caldilineaceae bacterium]|nr:type II toxin-antitoxin system VapC family toxin [Caldilineaceae bacterium]MBP8108521.1 type II toxin-antitoxin system VapC family toxin [Caldilineaceae bacterium]MBP8123543.1 type II toxin-antitoxin system VapC family toxin [Caldilineaceae bacterium]MBP9074389.1 type II toxin-antitoxin system VapC family toxin [Caldilineaceae bacterium]